MLALCFNFINFFRGRIMLDFFIENVIISITVFSALALSCANNLRSVKGDIETINKKRVEEGLPPMSDSERRITESVMRSSVKKDSLWAFVGGVITIAGMVFISITF